MIISTRKKFIFLAFNKTASTSIEHALLPYQNRLYSKWLRLRYERHYHKPIFKHIPAYRLKKIVWKHHWNNFFKFAVVRNPWERVISHYVTTEYANNTTYPEPLAFEKWVLEGKKGIFSGKKTMLDFIMDENGKLLIDFVARYENLENDLLVLENQTGIKIDIPHLNTSRRNHYKRYYTEASLDKINTFVNEDARHFGYVF